MPTSRQPRKPTIVDVAAAAGVSKSTVSRVVQNDAKVAEETRARVLAAIEELGYVPAWSAQLMRGEPLPSIGLFVSSVDIPIFGLLNRYLHEELNSLGYYVLQETIVNSTEQGRESAMENLTRMPIQGLMVSVGGAEAQLHQRFAERLPLVVVGRPEPTGKIHAVEYDEEFHGRILVDHLAELGHTKIAMQDARMSRTMGTWVRVQAQMKRAEELGLEYSATHTFGMSEEELERWLVGVVETGHTAVMSMFDRKMVQIMQIAKRLGIRIPEDISLTGSDGVMDGVDLLGLTTVRKPVELVGRTAARLMVEIVEGPPPTRPIRESFRGELILGRTAGPPPR